MGGSAGNFQQRRLCPLWSWDWYVHCKSPRLGLAWVKLCTFWRWSGAHRSTLRKNWLELFDLLSVFSLLFSSIGEKESNLFLEEKARKLHSMRVKHMAYIPFLREERKRDLSSSLWHKPSWWPLALTMFVLMKKNKGARNTKIWNVSYYAN